MSENGGEKTGKMFDRFVRLADWARPRVRVKQLEQPVIDPELVLAGVLQRWASETPEEFTAWLSKTIEEAHSFAEKNVMNHAGISYYTGYEAALRNIRARFEAWNRGQARTAPQGE